MVHRIIQLVTWLCFFSSIFYKLDGKQVLASPDWTLLNSVCPKWIFRFKVSHFEPEDPHHHPPDLKYQVIATLLYTTGTYLFLYFS
jgi:hypothetical protein